jgi:prepilin-type N-terminal cleavage/methylation domain-containing protein
MRASKKGSGGFSTPGNHVEPRGRKDSRLFVRRGFTITETMVALAVLVVIVTLLAQVGIASLIEQRRNARRQQALEGAVNVLEAAQACEWAALTPEWARAQRLPESLTEQLIEGKLLVQVEPEASRPHTKRITVEVHWLQEDQPARPVKLISLRSARNAAQSGGKP